jgi:hypothetical protein
MHWHTARTRKKRLQKNLNLATGKVSISIAPRPKRLVCNIVSSIHQYTNTSNTIYET